MAEEEWTRGLITNLEERIAKLEGRRVQQPYKGKLYLAGPMTGVVHLNVPAFAEAALRLREEGFDVLSPHEIPMATLKSYSQCMRACCRLILKVDMLYVLPGWEKSKGARFEVRMAFMLGLPVFEYPTGALIAMPADIGADLP